MINLLALCGMLLAFALFHVLPGFQPGLAFSCVVPAKVRALPRPISTTPSQAIRNGRRYRSAGQIAEIGETTVTASPFARWWEKT